MGLYDIAHTSLTTATFNMSVCGLGGYEEKTFSLPQLKNPDATIQKIPEDIRKKAIKMLENPPAFKVVTGQTGITYVI